MIIKLTVLVYLITPPFELKKKTFSDGFRWFEFEWGILRAGTTNTILPWGGGEVREVILISGQNQNYPFLKTDSLADTFFGTKNF